MITLNLLIAAVVIYFLGVYLAYFAFGVAGEPDEIDKLFIWLWPLFLVLLGIFMLSEMITPVAQMWATRLKPITGHIARLLRKPLFYLSLPFRPLTLGRLVREHLHLTTTLTRKP